MIKDTLDIKLWRVDSIDTYVTGDFSETIDLLQNLESYLFYFKS